MNRQKKLDEKVLAMKAQWKKEVLDDLRAQQEASDAGWLGRGNAGWIILAAAVGLALAWGVRERVAAAFEPPAGLCTGLSRVRCDVEKAELLTEQTAAALVIFGAVIAGIGALLSAIVHNRFDRTDVIADHMGKLLIVCGLSATLTVALIDAPQVIATEVTRIAASAGLVAFALIPILVELAKWRERRLSK